MRYQDITDVQWAYAAGLIDGEGAIRVRNLKNGRITTAIEVGNTNEQMIQWLEDTFGGSVYLREHTNKHSNRKPWWMWYLPTSFHTEFLRGILPYIVSKRVVVEGMLKARQTIGQGNTKAARKERQKILMAQKEHQHLGLVPKR